MPKGGEFPPQRGGSLLLLVRNDVPNEVKGDAWMARASKARTQPKRDQTKGSKD